MQLTDSTYVRLVRIISDATGIQLGENRRQMLRNRIAGRVRQLGLTSYEDYLKTIENRNSPDELRTLIDSITTNYTGFFRDQAQFEHLGQVLEQLFQIKNKKIRIWSAACSTGEEVYSLAITAFVAAERCNADINRVRILATDISQKVLCQAFRGVYPLDRIESLDEKYRRFFHPFDASHESAGNADPMARVDNELRGITIFRRINLCEPNLNVPGDIDVVFLRNVLIYFDANTIRKILTTCESKLAAGGYLYVGASESVGEYLPRMEVARPCVFRSEMKKPVHQSGIELTFPYLVEPVHA